MKALACLKIFRHLQTLYCTGSRSSAGVSHVQQPSADPWASILAEELHLPCIWYIVMVLTAYINMAVRNHTHSC